MKPVLLRLKELEAVSLDKGSHAKRANGMCVMEAAAWIAGEPHSDHPQCVSPVITRAMISWNDRLRSNAERDRLIKPLIPLMIGTRTTEADDLTRSWMALDWLARERTPGFLRLAGLTEEAALLEGLARIVDTATAKAARKALAEVRPKARAARERAWRRRAEARQRLWDKYGYTAAAAAAADADAAAADAADAADDADDAASPMEKAYKAAQAAAKTAAPNWSSQWGAAYAAARPIYDDFFATHPTASKLGEEVTRSQGSFQELVKRMCEVGRVPATT